MTDVLSFISEWNVDFTFLRSSKTLVICLRTLTVQQIINIYFRDIKHSLYAAYYLYLIV